MMKTTVFISHTSVKAKKRAVRDALKAKERAEQHENTIRQLWRDARVGTIVVVILSLCGGSPSHPAYWIEEKGPYRARPEDLQLNSYRSSFSHYWGNCWCRLATPEEIARFEALEEQRGYYPRPWLLWQGRPCPPAPEYPTSLDN